MRSSLTELRSKLAHSEKTVFFTGAGISTESGIPDYRSPNGIWTRFQPVYYQDFVRDEATRIRYWTMKFETHELYKSCTPNSSHLFISAFEKTGRLLGVITQNIDGLHLKAGTSKSKLVELHGTDLEAACLSCQKRVPAQNVFATLVRNNIIPPLCQHCGGFLKPATISFGQMMPILETNIAMNWARECDLFVVMGSSLQVHPAAELPNLAKRNGAEVAILNRDETPMDGIADIVIHDELKNIIANLM